MMKISKNSYVLILLVLVMAIALSGCSNNSSKPADNDSSKPADNDSVSTDNKPMDIVIATAGTSGAWYPIGTGMAEILSELDNNITATGEVTNGGIENVRIIGKDVETLGFVNNDAAYFGLNGQEPFEEKHNILGVAHLYPSTMQIAVLANSGINTVEDLIGKKVVVGPPASSSAVMSWNVFGEYGIGEDDIQGLTLSFAEGAEAMKDGHADALIVVSAHPNSAITELSFTKDVKLLEISPEMQEKVSSKYEYYGKFTIPAGTYTNIDENISTLSLGTMIIANENTSDEIVYEFVKGIYENLDQLSGVHAMAKQIAIEHAAGVPIPLHPGAEKYFKEVGIIK